MGDWTINKKVISRRSSGSWTKGHVPWNKGKKCPELGYGKFGKDNPARKPGIGEKISKALTGKKASKETKLKMSVSRKGRIVEEETKERLRKSLKGRKITWGNKIRETMVKKEISKGKRNGNWKGGITDENVRIRSSIESRLWRESVLARDNWTCQKCKEKGGKLQAHHIQNFADFPELRLAIDNGITFCKNCHTEFHIIYGNRKTTKEMIIKFYV